MRYAAFYAILFGFLILPGAASSRESRTARKVQQTEKQEEKKNAPAKRVEDWIALDDIKTGLEPQAPVEVQKDEQTHFVRELIRLQWRRSDPIDVWVVRPKTPAKIPVILYLYSYADDTDRFRDNGWCTRATQGGFAAVGFVSALTGQRYHNRPMKQWFISELPEALGSTVHDIQLILNYLAERRDLDMEHVGMFGMGSGGSIAILAAQADPRIKSLDLLDPWGDWPDLLRESPVVPDDERAKYITKKFLLSVATLDPVDSLQHLKTPSLRLQQTTSEPLTPNNAKKRIAAALPNPQELVQYSNAEEHFKAYQLTGLAGWLKQQLRAQSQSEAPDHRRASLPLASPPN
jgi:acetyl esterase/lipase